MIKKAQGVVKKNPGASVIDLGDGVAAIELHSKMNALGDDIVSLITQTLKPASQQVADFEAFVITGDSANFSVGANLMQLLLAMQEEEWDEVELAVRGVPEHDAGDQVLPAAGGGCAVWHVPGRRRGDLAACGCAAASCGALYGAGGGWGWADPGRRRMQGDAAASD